MKIHNICTVKTGYAFRSKVEGNPNGNISVIQPKDISNDGLLNAQETVRIDLPSAKPAYFLKNGAVLLASRGRFVATIYQGQFSEGCIASGALLVLTIQDEQAVLPEYLSLYFNSDRGNHQFNRLTEQTTIPSLTRASLEEMDIPIPPIEKQHKLIALERSKQRYNQLTKRKQQLLNNILNHELISTN